MTHILYVYGTLRPGTGETFREKGTMYDISGSFPGVVLGGDDEFTCERVEVRSLDAIDRYEGYYPDDPKNSLYIRRPFKDGFIYEFNREVRPEMLVQSGDWLVHTGKRQGRYGAGI